MDSCVDMVANSQVTTYMMCSGSDFFYVRSQYGHVMGDDLNGTLDCGCDTAQYNSFRKYYQNHLHLEKEGTDLIPAFTTGSAAWKEKKKNMPSSSLRKPSNKDTIKLAFSPGIKKR